ncbi:Hypothetical predicted protein [Olea europaea subsp. europaea]|uniref:Uncharacterized protein n=1 Tax=Olea europaea subsp. europaea TaxID=158383 RepID=A0A8S0SLK4_OLEEU|nr:Hypothetical predicted protein [Olea europaea subsp. europaea]
MNNIEKNSCINIDTTCLKRVAIDCLRLHESSVTIILGPHIQKLNLLRILVLELEGETSPEIFKKNLVEMLKSILCLEVVDCL